MSFVCTSLINLKELQLIVLQRAEEEKIEEKSKGTGRTDVTDKISRTDGTKGQERQMKYMRQAGYRRQV